MPSSDYALGFRSLDIETSIDELPVEGDLPSWLTGRLLRTGPAKFEVDADSYNHWFDGLAMLHGFGFDEGRVSYANRFLHSKSYDQAREHGRIWRSEFATDPCRSIFGRVMSIFSPKRTDNANVNVTRLGDRYVAMTETPMPIEFDAESLETVGHLPDPTGVDADITTAHPHFDADLHRALNYVAKFGRTSSYKVLATNPETLDQEVIARMETDRPAYMHSFGMTEHYIVLVEFPLVVNPLELLTSDKPFIENYQWRPERGTRFQVLRKSDGARVDEYRTDARFGFHHINAFEEEDELVVDIATYSDASIIDDLYLERLRSPDEITAAGRFERFRLQADGATVEVEPLSDTRLELPRINYRQRSTRPYGCVWGVGTQQRGNFIDQIVRIEVPSGASQTWSEEGCYPGEPIFVARPGADGEDDGILLSVVLDTAAEQSFLLVLDAADLTEIARCRVPHHIPFQFHGDYFSS